MMLIEREGEQSRLQAAIEDALAGHGSALVIEGPPGIGKTSLLGSAREIGMASGVRVLTAKAAALEVELGFALVRDLFAPVLSHGPGDLFSGAAQLAAGPLGLAGTDPQPVELASAVHGMYWLCANLADSGPMLLAVDDLHWADEPSLLFLTYLARRVADLPVAVCMTTRPPDDEPMARYLSALEADALAVLRPATLSDTGVSSVVESVLMAKPDHTFVGACARATGGNPFLLVEALAELRRDGIGTTSGDAAHLDDLRPGNLARSVQRRIDRLGPDGRRVAEGVAILGVDADVRRLSQLTELDPDVVSSAISGLRHEGVLAAEPPLDFVHPLIRNVVDSRLVEPERGLGHLRAARILDGDGTDERVASHLLRSTPTGDTWVVDRLRRSAALSLRAGSPATAATLTERALAEPPPEKERPALGLDLGRAHLMSGNLGAARAVLQKLVEATGDSLLRVDASVELGRVIRLSGDPAGAVALLDRALQDLPAGHHDHEMALEAEIAFASHMGLPVRDWIDRIAAVVDRADGPSMHDRLIRALYSYIAASTVTRTAGYVADLARSSIAGEETLPADLLQLAAAGLAMAGAFDDGVATIDRALDDTRSHGDAVRFGFASMTRAWVAHRAGRVREAEADARAGLTVALDGYLDVPYGVASVVIAMTEEGALDDAEALLKEHGLDQTTDLDAAPAGALYAARGRLHLARGRANAALVDIERSRDLVMKLGFTGPAFVEWRTDLALAHLSLGDLDAAREVAADDLAVSRMFGARREIGRALRVSGLIEGGARGLDLLTESAEVLAASEARLDHAKSLVELGAALRRAGHRPEAMERLRSGLDLASRCETAALATRARDELRAAGARPRRERLSGPDSLTASELRVARMAAEGRSNPEIAQALFVTRRTVEVHLTHAYRKLGIESRDELSAALGS